MISWAAEAVSGERMNLSFGVRSEMIPDSQWIGNVLPPFDLNIATGYLLATLPGISGTGGIQISSDGPRR